MTKIIPTESARQARWGRQVRMVLIGGLALAVVVWFGLEFYGEAIDGQVTGQSSGTVVQ